MSELNLKDEFSKRSPWITQFNINGQLYGGNYDAMNDQRVNIFFEHFPNAANILELGSLEGGHTLALASRPHVKKVVGIEGRQSSVEKCEFIKKIFGCNNIEFLLGNIESLDLASYGQFDSVFCSGLLYHLLQPWKLIENISKVSNSVLISTHYCKEELATDSANGYTGTYYKEFGLEEPLSGLSSESFWPTLEEIGRMLAVNGFVNTKVIQNNIVHPHGPSVLLVSTK